MIDYGNILSIFYQNKKWKIENSINYDTLEWLDESTKPSKSELDLKDQEAKIYYKKQDCKIEAKRRIAQYDWVIDTETTPDLLNREDFIAYRSALRQLILNPVENPTFPTEPNPIWSK